MATIAEYGSNRGGERREEQPTFVFKEIAHLCAPGQDELRDIFDDLGLVLGR